MTLLSLVILTGLSMELSMRRVFTTADTEAQLLGEATPIMTMVTKDINRGIGTIFSSPYAFSASGLDQSFMIRIDSNMNGTSDPGDRFVNYRFRGDLSPTQLWYYHNASTGVFEVLSNKVTVFYVSPPDASGASNVTLRVRKDPTTAVSYFNPEVGLIATAEYREYSYK